MNSNRHVIMMVVLVGAPSSFSSAHIEPSFFQKITSIKKDLYELSAQELCKFLGLSSEPIPTITADQLKKEMSTHHNLLVINVLPEHYHNDCHIKGSINAPLPELVERADSWDRSQKIVVYCALEECDAGEKASMLLKCMGFDDVTDYKGGIKEWYQLNYPTQGPALSEYLHTRGFPAVHAYQLYPKTIVCSNQTRWINRYQKQ